MAPTSVCFATVLGLLALWTAPPRGKGSCTRGPGEDTIGWAQSGYPSLDQSLWPNGVTWPICGKGGGLAREGGKMLSRQELRTPQAQNCCSHGNEPEIGSTQGALCGLTALERFLSH